MKDSIISRPTLFGQLVSSDAEQFAFLLTLHPSSIYSLCTETLLLLDADTSLYTAHRYMEENNSNELLTTVSSVSKRCDKPTIHSSDWASPRC